MLSTNISEKKLNIESIIEENLKIHINQIINLHNSLLNIDIKNISNICNVIRDKIDDNNIIYWCGVGKSGNIANHLSDLLKSLNIRSHFLNPLNSVHGDIGILKKNDIIILLSKSGNTEELLNIIPLLKEKGAILIGISNKKNNKFSQILDYNIVLPDIQELDPNNLLPTTSVISHLIMGNIIISSIMNYINFNLEDYKINHCAGSIGKKLLLKASDIMIPLNKIAICKKDDTFCDCILDICNKKCGVALIIEKKQLLGIITDGDIRRNILNNNNNIKVNSIMQTNPKYVLYNDSLYTIQNLLHNDTDQISCLPVINTDQEVVGLINHDCFLNI